VGATRLIHSIRGTPVIETSETKQTAFPFQSIKIVFSEFRIQRSLKKLTQTGGKTREQFSLVQNQFIRSLGRFTQCTHFERMTGANSNSETTERCAAPETAKFSSNPGIQGRQIKG
jgi:hypothetical protein